MRLRSPASLLLLAPLLALAAASPASADVSWGYDPGDNGEWATCADTCTVAQARESNQSFDEVLFSGRGVITGWRATTSGGEIRLRVLGGTEATDWVVDAGGSITPTRLPVRAGQLVALDLRGGAKIGFREPLIADGADVVHRWSPARPDGAGPDGASTILGNVSLRVVIEPDADGDGFGDDSQDPDRGQGPQDPGPVDPGPGGPGPNPGPGDPTPGPADPTPGGDDGPKPLPSVPKSGPRLTVPKTPAVSKSGVVSVALTNPYGAKLTGAVTGKVGKKRVGRAGLSLAAGATKTVELRLNAAARRTLKRRKRLSLKLEVAAKAAGTKRRTSRRTVVLRPAKRSGGGGSTSGGGANGGSASRFDGTFRASDGQVMAVRDGVVQSFNGSITLWCTRAGRQKLVTYSMIGDDPRPKVAADGSFAWEATAGYGFQKLKFQGRISGDTATGNLVVEDRSPLLGTGRFEFDYCFAGKDWRLQR